MNVNLNGEPTEVPEAATITQLVELTGAGADQRGLAVAVAGEVVPRSEWDRTRVSEGASIDVVAAIQGGADEWELGGRRWGSRLVAGSGGFRSLEQMSTALEKSGTEIITVALRRLDPAATGSRPSAPNG